VLEPESEIQTIVDSRDAAESAGLTYVSDDERGIRRKRVGKGFVYLKPNSEPVRDAATLERIRKLAIPPAWTDVWICPKANGQSRRGFIAASRYRPEQWDEVRRWRTYREEGERWFGFEAVRDLDGLPPEILMIPLPGHTRGHAGIAVDTPEGWLLNAGDAYFFRHEVDRPERVCPPGARAYERMMAVDPDLHYHNQQRVRALANDARAGVRIFCSHDAVEFAALSELRNGPRNAGAARASNCGRYRGAMRP
jgi:hypothetical protein